MTFFMPRAISKLSVPYWPQVVRIILRSVSPQADTVNSWPIWHTGSRYDRRYEKIHAITSNYHLPTTNTANFARIDIKQTGTQLELKCMMSVYFNTNQSPHKCILKSGLNKPWQ